jgi:hypothetical protein
MEIGKSPAETVVVTITSGMGSLAAGKKESSETADSAPASRPIPEGRSANRSPHRRNENWKIVDMFNSPDGRQIFCEAIRRTDRQGAETILVLASHLPPPAEPCSSMDVMKFIVPRR